MEYLFSYGTLQLDRVQIQTYGRKLKGVKDEISNFKIEQIEIFDDKILEKSKQRFHPIAIPTQNEYDYVEGVIYEITKQELLETDAYEVSNYKRLLKRFKSGKKAWIYVFND